MGYKLLGKWGSSGASTGTAWRGRNGRGTEIHKEGTGQGGGI